MIEDKRKSKIGDDPFAGLPRRQLYAHEKFVDKPVTKPVTAKAEPVTTEAEPVTTKAEQFIPLSGAERARRHRLAKAALK